VTFENGKAIDKRYKDERGLFLLVRANGSKLWRYGYSFRGKKYTYAIGKYPLFSLKMARDKVTELETLRAKDINPTDKKRETKLQYQIEKRKTDTVEKVCEMYLRFKKDTLSESTLKKHSQNLIKNVYPLIGSKEIKEVTRLDIITISQRIQERGALESGHRVGRLLNAIWRYALQLEKVEHNIISDISFRDVLKPFKNENFRTIVDKNRIGEMLRAIDNNLRSEYTTRYLLKILPFVFARSANIRMMEWCEIDFEAKTWTIPAHKMKMRKEHKMPLSDEAIKIIKEVQPYTIGNVYVFSSPVNRAKPLSENTINKALKQIGFHDEIVGHGFRAMFSTIANESGLFRREAIESLMAHKVSQNKVEGAYNRAKYEDEKKALIDWWNDYLLEAKNLVEKK
jgi:integrase